MCTTARKRRKVIKPHVHAHSSAKNFGGVPDDYINIHQQFDETKALFPDNRHRAIFHTAFGIFIIEKIFGKTLINSDGKEVSVRDIGEQHVLEDFGGVIPTLQDFLSCMRYEKWMHGNGRPPSQQSSKNIKEPEKPTIIEEEDDPMDMVVDVPFEKRRKDPRMLD